jgi:hypothetical protein
MINSIELTSGMLLTNSGQHNLALNITSTKFFGSVINECEQ